MKTDYLVVGCGASSMAFVDAMLAESDASFVIVDRRDAPGGHWNDAYPFVRLHQPSSFYGVASRPLGRDRVERKGLNAGMYELASGVEVLAYFHAVMTETFLPSGRVVFMPLSEWRDEDGVVVSLIDGGETKVDIGRALVDGRRIGTEIPLTYRRRFEVSDGVDCVPPNDLPRHAAGRSGFVVLGAGKTAMDGVIWLLTHGVDPDAITWVRPRDAWMINRRFTQPGIEFFDDMIGGQARQTEILAGAGSVAEVCAAMEAEGFWLRIDPERDPEMFHAAVISEAELAQLRRVRDVVRAGHVRRIEPDRMIMDEGEVPIGPGRLIVDCAASAAGANVVDRDPVFSPGRINLQMIRPYQPTFSAAVIGHLEATVADEALKRAATRVTPMIDTVEDWIERRLEGVLNQAAWNEIEGLSGWITACRLDAPGRALSALDPTDEAKMEVIGRLRAATPPSVENMRRLVGGAPAAVPA